MDLPLAYNSNQHPAETVDELIAALSSFTLPLRERLGWPLVGLDLRLSSTMIAECISNPQAISRLRRALDQAGAVAYTINAFPLSAFQSTVVKDQAYHPDWTTQQRITDSIAAIDLACQLCDADPITISTVPGSFKPWGASANNVSTIAAAWGHWAAAAARYQREYNRCVILCPEPEPLCTLETSSEVIALWQDELASTGLAAASAALDGDTQAGAQALAQHLALCYDTCHASVEFEHQASAVAKLSGAGITPRKVQFSACPEVLGGAANQPGIASLQAMHEPRFLHQTALQQADGQMHMVYDLDHLAAGLDAHPDTSCIRSHFHIPINQSPAAAGLTSTVNDSLLGLQACLKHGAEHIAVETYTWSLLADSDLGALAGTAAELLWLNDQLSTMG